MSFLPVLPFLALDMAIEAIKRYLDQNVQNYQEGRILFDRYSMDSVLKLLFRSGSSSYHHRRLLQALRDLSTSEISTEPTLDPLPKKTAIPQLSEFDRPAKHFDAIDYHSLPEAIQEVVRKKNMHYKRAQQLFIEIGFTTDKENRLEMALVMLEDHEQVNVCWSVIDEYKETGKILSERSKSLEEEIALVPEVSIGQSIANLRSNISKDRKKLESLPEGHKKAKVLLRYQTNKIKLDLLIKRLEVTDV